MVRHPLFETQSPFVYTGMKKPTEMTNTLGMPVNRDTAVL